MCKSSGSVWFLCSLLFSVPSIHFVLWDCIAEYSDLFGTHVFIPCHSRLKTLSVPISKLLKYIQYISLWFCTYFPLLYSPNFPLYTLFTGYCRAHIARHHTHLAPLLHMLSYLPHSVPAIATPVISFVLLSCIYCAHHVLPELGQGGGGRKDSRPGCSALMQWDSTWHAVLHHPPPHTHCRSVADKQWATASYLLCQLLLSQHAPAVHSWHKKCTVHAQPPTSCLEASNWLCIPSAILSNNPYLLTCHTLCTPL